jgi:hypothetical protein
MAKLHEFPLSAKQRSEIEADLANPAIQHIAICKKLSDWGFEWGESSVRRYRKNLGIKVEAQEAESNPWAKAEIEVGFDGGEFTTGAMSQPLEMAGDWNGILLGFGLDPEVFEVVGDTVRMSKWQSSKRLENGDRDIIWLYSYRAQFRRKSDAAIELDFTALQKRIDQWKPLKKKFPESYDAPCTFVTCWADWQIGKSAGGGVDATVDRVHDSFDLTLDRIEELRKSGRNIEQIAVFNMGDPTEGCDGNYASQLFTVELTQREQLNLVMELWTNGILALEPDVFASVLCNHGEWTRRGGSKSVTSDSDNAGGYLADTLQRVFDGRPNGPSEWYIAHDEMVQLIPVSGVNIGITHGHKISSAAKETEWLRGQSIRLLRQEGAEPDLWVTAHMHHVKVEDMGPWWRIQCPSLDGGSKWFTDFSGKWSTPGTMTFLAGQHDIRGWSDIAVLGSYPGHV